MQNYLPIVALEIPPPFQNLPLLRPRVITAPLGILGALLACTGLARVQGMTSLLQFLWARLTRLATIYHGCGDCGLIMFMDVSADKFLVSWPFVVLAIKKSPFLGVDTVSKRST